jgi:Cu+-exporting ATPase
MPVLLIHLAQIGDRVYGGSLNVDSFLVVEVTAIAGESTLANIANRYCALVLTSTPLTGCLASSVRRAQQTRVRAQALADRVARVFVPVILGVALCTFVVWLLLATYGIADVRILLL